MRQRAKVDANQKEIVKALEEYGATVLHLHQVGKGCPDIAVGWRGVNYFFEIKDGAKFKSERKLTADEKRWHETWRGTVHVIESKEQALMAIGAIFQ